MVYSGDAGADIMLLTPSDMVDDAVALVKDTEIMLAPVVLLDVSSCLCSRVLERTVVMSTI